ncbi:MAG: SCO1664 family protein [Jatrophihabitantaceae bacterium]
MNELTDPVALPAADALALLNCGEITVEGRVTSASNATMYCRIELDGLVAACVYKPISGERPLWDYPDGTLAEREVASYLVGAATGWDLVPPTVLRAGPLGNGMVQLWVADDESFDIITAINAGSYPQLQRMALLDAVVNNSDRKVSHLLPIGASELHGGELHVFGVDHGVSFGVDNKLRTVLWQWAGDPIPDDGIAVLTDLNQQLAGELGASLSELLTTAEVRATQRRVQRLLAKRKFPMPPTDWPAIPYPPY